MPTIYLSSTFEDLKDFRQAVLEGLHKSEYHVFNMENYVAGAQRPVGKCLNDVAKADLYIGLFAFRYGHIPPAHHQNPGGLSITELEYRKAQELQKPCLIFVAKEDAGIPLTMVDACTGDNDKGEKINNFRKELLTETLTSQFSHPQQLATLVLAAVKTQLEQRVNPGAETAPQSASLPPIIWDIDKLGSPFPGLLHFTRKYAPVFFGRELEVVEVLDRMRQPENRFLLISGDSGSGKSSVVDAGVLPRLETGCLPDAQPCLSVRMVPSQRQQPMEALLGALGSVVTQAGLRPDSLLDKLTQAPESVGTEIMAIMKASAASRTLVLFIDQMEELFTAHDVTQANRFLSALYQASQEKALRVIGTIRSDHLHHCHRHPEMVKVLNSPMGHYALGPVKPYMMQDMILKPAQAAGLTIDETFAIRLIRESEAESGNLPLLAFVLDRLFQNRVDHALSEAVYDRLGGVAGAIGVHVKQVEATIERDLGIRAAKALPVLFHALAKVQKEEGIPTRNRQKKAEFPKELHPMIDRLVTERLLRTEGEEEEATISISHEKLFEAWPALKEYVETNKKALVDRTLLESRAQKWATLGKPSFSSLATGREYHDFQQAGANPGGLTKEFLDASRRARHLWMGAGLVVLLLLGSVTWPWQKGYNVEQALLKVRDLVVSIHVPPEMVPIPGGTFRQGDEFDFIPEVNIQALAMSKHEVTFDEYDRFALSTNRPLPNDQGWGRGRRPVIYVSWDEARAYAAWLSQETGQSYRLPTESEWEYAARSGNKEDVWAGTSDESELGDYAVFRDNSGNRTALVGSKQANSFELKDMSGNVWEWVEDCWHGDYRGAPTDGKAWLEAGGGECGQRVIRGGSWDDSPVFLRSSFRFWNYSDFRLFYIGFRLAQDTP